MILECVEKGTPIGDRCHKRTFYQRMNSVIGASAGEHTNCLFVEYINTGLVHGWPIAESELQRKLNA